MLSRRKELEIGDREVTCPHCSVKWAAREAFWVFYEPDPTTGQDVVVERIRVVVTPDMIVCEGCRVQQEILDRREQADELARRETIDRAHREARVLELIGAAGASPWEHGHATLENYACGESRTPLDATIRFVREAIDAGQYHPVKGLYLFGDTGCGKTHLAVAALRTLLLEESVDPSTIIFDHASGLIAEIQDTYNSGRSSWEILEHRFNAAVWILDDFGSERASEDVVKLLTLIFTRRALRPTLVTSNNHPGILEQRHPEFKRVQSRLGTKYFRTVEVKGHDRRFDRRAS